MIQVDVDSTLYDADQLFGDLAEEAGIKWPRRDYGWKSAGQIFKEDGTTCNRADLVTVFRKAHSSEYVSKNEPYPDSVEVLTKIVEDFPEVELAYVSDRNSQQSKALRDWLEERGFITSDDTYVAATKDKRHWMREKRPEIVIDDRIRTLLMARYELGAYCIGLEHNHNINLKGEADHIYIEPSWKGIDNVLREIVLPKVQEKGLSKSYLGYVR